MARAARSRPRQELNLERSCVGTGFVGVVEGTNVEVSEMRGDCWIYLLYLTMIQWFERSGVESPGSLQTLQTQDETRGLLRVWRVFGGMMAGMMTEHGWN